MPSSLLYRTTEDTLHTHRTFLPPSCAISYKNNIIKPRTRQTFSFLCNWVHLHIVLLYSVCHSVWQCHYLFLLGYILVLWVAGWHAIGVVVERPHRAPWLRVWPLKARLLLAWCYLDSLLPILIAAPDGKGRSFDETSKLEVGNNKWATARGSSVLFLLLFWWHAREVVGVASQLVTSK